MIVYSSQTVLHHQLADLGSGFPQPSQNRLFLVTSRAGDVADQTTVGQLRERFDDVTRRSLAPINLGPFRRRQHVMAGATLIALLSVACSTKLDDVPLCCGLRLLVISAIAMGQKSPGWINFDIVLPDSTGWCNYILPTLVRETIRKCFLLPVNSWRVSARLAARRFSGDQLSSHKVCCSMTIAVNRDIDSWHGGRA